MKYLPLSHSAATELVPLFRRALEICKVTAEETVLVYGDTQTPPHYAAAFLGAAMELGAIVAQMTVPSLSPAVQAFDYSPDPNAPEDIFVKAWKAANLVVDLVPGVGKSYTKVNTLALRAGTRVFRVTDPVDVLARLFPNQRMKERVIAAGSLLKRATTIRVASQAGTDLTMRKTPDRKIGHQYGFADEPGHGDYWTSGQTAVAPVEDSAEGTLVMSPGDILLPLSRYVTSPVRFKITGGRIADIQGDGLDAFLLREFFSSWNDPNAYVVSHIGWGLQDKADWLRMGNRWLDMGGLHDCEGFYGDVQIAFGNNVSYALAGKNESRAHIDIDLRNCSFYLDGDLIVDRGNVLPEDQKP